MFNKNFFPSPRPLIEQMLNPYQSKHLQGKYILEPSAGKGDIAEVLSGRSALYSERDRAKVYVCEIEPELQAILRDKGYPVVASDFLAYEPQLHYDFIFMNPPFDHCEEHLLHAWQILYAGEIVCVFPKRHLEGKFSDERVILDLIEKYGTQEDAGRAFAQGAERCTDEEIVIIRLKKQAPGDKIDFDFDPKNTDEFEAPENDDKGQELSFTGYIKARLAYYQAAMGAIGAENEARCKLVRYVDPLNYIQRDGNEHSTKIIDAIDAIKTPKERYNLFVELLTESAWNQVLDHPGFSAIMTKRTEEALKEFRKKQRRLDFNAENIGLFLQEVASREKELLMGAVIDSFQIMTKYDEGSKDPEVDETWKTNKGYRVGHKVILPWFIQPFDRMTNYFHLNYHRERELDDIDRGICLVAQRKWDDIQTVRGTLQEAFRGYRSDPGSVTSTFFECRFFKKGTLHLIWHDDNLRNEFNITAARGLGWLPRANQSQG